MHIIFLFRHIKAGLIFCTLIVAACEFTGDPESQMRRAQAALEQGDLRAAAIELKNVLRADPVQVQARVMLGDIALQSGDADTALKELRRASELGAEPDTYMVPMARAMAALDRHDELLLLNPADLSDASQQSELHALQGDALLRKQQVDQARGQFEIALDLSPDNPLALIGIAGVKLSDGDPQAAEAAINKVITQQADFHRAHAALGRLRARQADFAAAEASLREAIRLADEPTDRRDQMMYLASLVDVQLAQKKAGEAQDTAAKLLQMAPQHPYALFQAARADFEAGQFQDSIAKSQQVIAAYPNYQPAILLLAASAIARENFALAEMHLRAVVSRDPGNVQARKLLAQARMNLGNPEEALAVLQPMLSEQQDDPALLALAGSAQLAVGQSGAGVDLIQRGVAAGGDVSLQLTSAAKLVGAGQPEEALALLETIPADQHSEQHEAITIIALLQAGRSQEALATAEAAHIARPNDPATHRMLAGYYVAAGDAGMARKFFDSGLELDPNNEPLMVGLAKLELAQGNQDQAEAIYRQLLERVPGSLVAYRALAGLALQEGNQDKAVAVLEQARQANPGASWPYTMLARQYLSAGKLQRALARAEEAYEINPDDPEVLTTLGTARLANGRHGEALGSLQQALQMSPQNVDAQFQLARTQLKMNLNDAAMASLRKTVELDPQHLGAQIALARMQGLRGNYTAALEVAQLLKEQHPGRAEPFVLAGDIHIMRGHFNDAIEAYDHAGTLLENATITIKRFDARKRAGRADSYVVLENYLEENPTDYQTRIVLAQAYSDAGMNDQSIAEYRNILEEQPDNLVAQNNLAWVYAQLGGTENLQQGVTIAKQAHLAAPDNGAIADTYGWLLLQQGNTVEGMRLIRQALELAPENPDIRYHLAVALHRGGADAEARSILDQLLLDHGSFSSRDAARSLRDSL